VRKAAGNRRRELEEGKILEKAKGQEGSAVFGGLIRRQESRGL